MQKGFDSSKHLWPEVKKLGVNPGVESLEHYERLVAVGTHAAQAAIRDFRLNCFQAETARIVHHLIFEQVHPWAGESRDAGQSVIIAGYPGADAWRIERELHLLAIQSESFSERVEGSFASEEIEALRCAFHHLRFERIHPFRDGNGRVGRLLMASAFRRHFSDAAYDWRALRADYFEALRMGNRGELSGLTNILLSGAGLSAIGLIQSPFRIGPRMFEDFEETTIEDDLTWSIPK